MSSQPRFETMASIPELFAQAWGLGFDVRGRVLRDLASRWHDIHCECKRTKGGSIKVCLRCKNVRTAILERL